MADSPTPESAVPNLVSDKAPGITEKIMDSSNKEDTLEANDFINTAESRSLEIKDAKFETESLVVIEDTENSDSFVTIDPQNFDETEETFETKTFNDKSEILSVSVQDNVTNNEEISKTEFVGEFENSRVTDNQRKDDLAPIDDSAKNSDTQNFGISQNDEIGTKLDEPSSDIITEYPLITTQDQGKNSDLENVGGLEMPISKDPPNLLEGNSLVILGDNDNIEKTEKDITDKIDENLASQNDETIQKVIQSDFTDITEKDDPEVLEILSPKIPENSNTIESILASALDEGQTLSSDDDIYSPESDSPILEFQAEYREIGDDLKSEAKVDVKDDIDMRMDIDQTTGADEDKVVYYEDRPNSAEQERVDDLSYVYPIEKEFWDIEDKQDPAITQARWKELYHNLHMVSVERMPSQRVARMQHNRPLNRYSNILANDNTRIILTHQDTDYINANLVTVPEVDRRYIMSQGPLNITAEHFWHMIWQEESMGIVMLNKTFESGKMKCFQYFPDSPGEQLVFGNYLIFCDTQFEASAYRLTNLELTYLPTQELRQISHFQYLTWPDFGAPQTPEDFLQFLAAVRERGILNPELCGPPVVHCSAGVGRSGTFILVDACLRRIEIEGNPTNVHVQNMVLQMREQRFGCIQSDAQLRFSYVAILVATHNIMTDLPIATVPELVENARRKLEVDSPIPPRRTSSKSQIKLHSTSPEPLPDIPPPETQDLPITKMPAGTTESQLITEEIQEARLRKIEPKINPVIVDVKLTPNPPPNYTFKISLAVITLAIVALLIYQMIF